MKPYSILFILALFSCNMQEVINPTCTCIADQVKYDLLKEQSTIVDRQIADLHASILNHKKSYPSYVSDELDNIWFSMTKNYDDLQKQIHSLEDSSGCL